MFGWGRKNDGFEWRQYVRTTILVRREKRRQKMDDLREAAVNKVKEAGEKGVRAGAAGAGKVGQAARAGLAEAGRSLNEQVIPGVGAGLSRAWAAVAAPVRRMWALIGDWSRRDSARRAMLWLAAAAGFWAAARTSGHGFDREATVAAAAAIAALSAAGLMALAAAREGTRLGDVSAGLRGRLAGLPLADLMAGGGRRIVVGMAVLVAAVAGAVWLPAWLSGRGSLTMPSLAGLVATKAEEISGRATAITGDTLRIGSRVLRLAGIEAPEVDQKCGQGGTRTWPCGTAASQALASRVRAKTVTCELDRADSDGRPRAVCRVETADVAAELVRGGHVFAIPGWFSRYAALESEAREARSGLWRGNAERPSDYRNKRWEEARRSAPDGCPIKGQKTSDRLVYVLPWAPEYDRIKIRTQRGERWFCSEAEAKAAGFKRSEQS
jgi:endonuclease YncB( thermonuclease family)